MTSHVTDENLLAFADLATKGIPFTRQHVARLIKEGRFPAPIKLGVGTNRWIASEIDEWIGQRKTERDAALARRRGEG
jgi:prophage regulatory protein